MPARLDQGVGRTLWLLDDAERKIMEIAQSGGRWERGGVMLDEAVQSVLDVVEHAPDRSGLTGLASGFLDLDRMTLGFQKSDMIIIAGRPSMGKTALALSIVEHVGVGLRKPVAFFSMEMSVEQVAMRMISMTSNVELTKLRAHTLLEEDYERIVAAMTKINNAPVVIDDTPALSSAELKARARRLHRRFHEQGGLSLIVIDYLQLMRADQECENRVLEISEISRALKALAKELNIPVIVLSQLSRRVESRVDKRPIMSDLRESGAIEQDADLVLLMYRDEYYNPNSQNKGIAEVIIGKHRNGPTGSVELAYLGQYTKFANLAKGMR